MASMVAAGIKGVFLLQISNTDFAVLRLVVDQLQRKIRCQIVIARSENNLQGSTRVLCYQKVERY